MQRGGQIRPHDQVQDGFAEDLQEHAGGFAFAFQGEYPSNLSVQWAQRGIDERADWAL